MKEKLFIGVFWLGTARVIINILSLISTIILARLLSPEDFGLVAIVMTLLSIIEAVTNLSVSSALVHHKSLTEEHFHTAWSINITRSTLIALLFSCSASLVADYYHDARLVNIVHMVSISIFVSGLINPKMVVLTKKLIFWQEFVISVSQKLMSVLVSLIFAYQLQSYWAIVAGTVTAQAVGVIVTYIIIPFKPKLSFKHLKEIWSFSIWLTLGTIVNTLNWRFDHLLIGSQLGSKTLGFYTVGDDLAALPTRQAIQPLENILFPGFTQISNDIVRLRNAYIKSQTLITFIALPLGIGLASVASPLVILLMGEKWEPSVQIIQIIACVYVLQTLGSQVHPIAMAVGKTKTLFYRDMVNFTIRLPIIISGFYFFGLIGIVIGRGISGTISLLINMSLLSKMLKLPVLQQINQNSRAVASVLLMVLFILWIDIQPAYLTKMQLFIQLATVIASSAVLYLVSNFTLWVVMNKPSGAETEIIKLSTKVIEKLRSL